MIKKNYCAECKKVIKNNEALIVKGGHLCDECASILIDKLIESSWTQTVAECLGYEYEALDDIDMKI